MQHAESQIGIATSQNIGQRLPDRLSGGRTPGDEPVNLDHFMQGVNLVQRQRQFRVIRYQAVRQPGAGVIDLFENLGQLEMVALRRQPAIHRTGPKGHQFRTARAKLAQDMNVLGIAQPALDNAQIAIADFLDVGQ